MSKRTRQALGTSPDVRSRMSPDALSRRRLWIALFVGVAVVAAIAIAAFMASTRPGGQAAWARLDTADVHSLAFVGDDPDHVLFGHHGGISESLDGGRTWHPLPTGADAMAMGQAVDGSIVIAGHEVFMRSTDGGQTWQPISADLPSLDIHGFTRDPADPGRMWAYLATGGLWESTDAGTHWLWVREHNVILPLAVRHEGGTRLLGVDATGLVSSDDSGRTWVTLGAVPTYPMASLAATTDGTVLYAGSPDGLFRSADRGQTWIRTAFRGFPFAIATSKDGRTVALVDRTTEFFRSSDGGASWPGP